LSASVCERAGDWAWSTHRPCRESRQPEQTALCDEQGERGVDRSRYITRIDVRNRHVALTEKTDRRHVYDECLARSEAAPASPATETLNSTCARRSKAPVSSSSAATAQRKFIWPRLTAVMPHLPVATNHLLHHPLRCSGSRHGLQQLERFRGIRWGPTG
jgi:hypothetical protein